MGGGNGADSTVILKGYQSSLKRLLRMFPLLPLLPGALFLQSILVLVKPQLFRWSSNSQLTTTFSVSLSGNSRRILNPFHSDYKSTTLLYYFWKLLKYRNNKIYNEPQFFKKPTKAVSPGQATPAIGVGRVSFACFTWPLIGPTLICIIRTAPHPPLPPSTLTVPSNV